MWLLPTTRRSSTPLIWALVRNTTPVSALKSPSKSSSFGSMATPSSDAYNKPYKNVLLSSAYLMPIRGKMITAHSTRQKVLDLLQETQSRCKKDGNERAMIVDISATVWNWDTYAIVAGKPSPVKLTFSSKEEMRNHLPLNEEDVAQEGILVPQRQESNRMMVWVPKGAMLKEINPQDDDDDSGEMQEFVFECPVDPNDDRLEHWEQEVKNQELYKARTKLAAESMRSMLRFYELDRIVCWDLSWGIWEAIRDTSGDETCDESGDPKMLLVKDGKANLSFPSSVEDNDDEMATMKLFYDYARPISSKLLKETLTGVSGYYLVGGNTYTMSLFHHMWDQQAREGEEDGNAIGHMQLLRNQLRDGKLFYMGHSAGLIMSGPNILTATFKGIDAFSVVTQPYNSPFVRLPPSETPDTFFASEKNNLFGARTQMLNKMHQYGAWRGYNVVEALAFPHYDARPRVASFPQSAETYLRATDAEGRFAQPEGSLLVGKTKDKRIEREDVTRLREATNAKGLPCYPVANGHAFVMDCGGLKVLETLSPEEEGEGILHWDTYMPFVPDEDHLQYESGRNQFTVGSFTSDADTLAGDRSSSNDDYKGDRIFSRLEALGLPNPNASSEGHAGRLFRSK